MKLNKSKGNMYEFITHTGNIIKGQCYHNCSYCYVKSMMKRFKKIQPPVYFDEKEIESGMKEGNFIFVGSSNDMFAKNISNEWLFSAFDYLATFEGNRYFFQTKNPKRLLNFNDILGYNFKNSCVCITLETNRYYPEYMGRSPKPIDRVESFSKFSALDKYITIEPIMDFDLKEFVEMIKSCRPVQVNIGADSGHNNLPEPSKEKVLELISELQKFKKIHNKSNLKRLL
jgi:DNA repair photolyase